MGLFVFTPYGVLNAFVFNIGSLGSRPRIPSRTWTPGLLSVLPIVRFWRLPADAVCSADDSAIGLCGAGVGDSRARVVHDERRHRRLGRSERPPRPPRTQAVPQRRGL